MAGIPTPIFPQVPRSYTVALTTTNSTTFQTLVTGGVNGTKITSVIASNLDSTANNMRLAVTTGGANFIVSLSSLAAGAGFLSSLGNPAVSLLGPGFPVDNDGQQYLFLGSTAYTLTVQTAATLSSAGSTVNVTAFGADF